MVAASVTDLIAEYDELVLGGRAPEPAAFCAAHPGYPSLLRRLQQLKRLRGDLEELFSAEPAPAAGLPTIEGFRLLQVLGRGGMGSVYLAEQNVPRRRCALKVLESRGPSSLERFRREADLAARLAHPGIATVYTFGEADGQAYLAAEMVHGFSLRDLLAAADRVSPQRPDDWIVDALRRVGESEDTGGRATSTAPVAVMVGLIAQIADALAHAHQRGVIHRDVKPSNIIVDYEGRAKLIDFGIAIAAQDEDERLTRTGTFIGSHGYAAPEQLRGEHDAVGRWTDTYALGATLFEVLTQRTPFDASTYAERLATVDQPPAHGPRHYNPQVSAALDALVMRALDPSSARRFADGEEMAAALRSCPTAASFWPAIRWPWLRRLLPRRPAEVVGIAGVIATVLLGDAYVEKSRELDLLRTQHRATESLSGHAVLEHVVQAHKSELEACLPVGGAPPSGPAVVRLSVSAGLVRQVDFAAATALGEPVRTCLGERLGVMQLPGVGYGDPLVLEIDLRVRAPLEARPGRLLPLRPGSY